MSSELELKKELLALLADENNDNSKQELKEKLDYSQILNLAAQLSEHDDENVRFSVDGNLVKRLGEQLVAKKTTALSELIKNGYDADATKLDVIFENTDSPGGTITIFDNGNGMSKEALINGFMRISTSDKEENPVSPVFERPRAGRKGIGRFSAQKIGEQLTIITRTSPFEPYQIIKIDWSEYTSNTNLLAVSNAIEESEEDHGFEKGTKLIISRTREPWSQNNLSATYRYISSVIKVTPKTLSNGVVDPGFASTFFASIPISGELLPILTDSSEFLSDADAIISASIDDSGRVSISIKAVNDLDINDSYVLTEKISEALQKARFKFQAHYFSLSRGSRRSHLQTYLRENGGIRLYRNGFYVAPYGERYNDWLALDESSRRRLILPPHANTNFVGNIDIIDTEGSLFDETSSREGLIENAHFIELRDTSYEVITSAVKRIASARGKKVTSNQQGYTPTEKTLEEKIEDSFSSVSQKIEDLEKQPTNEKQPDDNLDLFSETPPPPPSAGLPPDVTKSLKESLDEQKEIIQELIDEKNMYRVLASTGLAIAEFTHEVHLYLNNLTLNGKQLNRIVQEIPDAVGLANDMGSNIDMLVSYTDFFTETIRNNSQRTKGVIEIQDVFHSFFKAMKPTLDRRKYELSVAFTGDEFWTKPMHISELSSVMMNLFTNACKAIVRAGKAKGQLKVQITSLDEDIVIRFEDNGDGIPKENWGRVFKALFTTEAPQEAYGTDAQQMRGMGLGLTITREIVEGVEGDIAVVEPSIGYSTCIEVVIPKANESEIPENAY